MNKLLYIRVLLLFFFFSPPDLYSQSISRNVIGIAGKTMSKPDLSVTYVIGEAVGDLFAASGNYRYFTTGFPQPDIELKQILDVKIDQNITLFPNPATNIVKVGLNNVPDAYYTIDLIDMAGRTLQSNPVVFSNNNLLYVNINVSQYAAGMYIIRVRSDKQYNGQAKLIKQ
jgi:hypothetical protein